MRRIYNLLISADQYIYFGPVSCRPIYNVSRNTLFGKIKNSPKKKLQSK